MHYLPLKIEQSHHLHSQPQLNFPEIHIFGITLCEWSIKRKWSVRWVIARFKKLFRSLSYGSVFSFFLRRLWKKSVWKETQRRTKIHIRNFESSNLCVRKARLSREPLFLGLTAQQTNEAWKRPQLQSPRPDQIHHAWSSFNLFLVCGKFRRKNSCSMYAREAAS